MAPVPASTGARKSPVGKNRVLVTSAPAAEPPPEAEQPPRLARLNMALAVCFSLGVAWPILADVQLTQRPPGSNAVPKAVETETDGADGDPSPAPTSELPAMHAAPLAIGGELPSIESRVVQSCEGNAGETLPRCDAPQLDGVLREPLAKLAACGRAQGVSGVLSLGMYADFSRGQITQVKAGQSTTLNEEQTATLLACAEESVIGAALDPVEHEHPRYWVYYVMRLGAPRAAREAAGASDVVSASGQATIGWTTAIVRESPSSQAPIASRLAFGTRVTVTGRAGDWYRIERSAKKPLGWVHRDALGL